MWNMCEYHIAFWNNYKAGGFHKMYFIIKEIDEIA